MEEAAIRILGAYEVEMTDALPKQAMAENLEVSSCPGEQGGELKGTSERSYRQSHCLKLW